MRDEGKIFSGQKPLVANRDYWRSSNRRQEQSEPEQKWFLKLSLVILVVSAITWAWLKLQDPQMFPIQHVQVQGSYAHVNHQILPTIIQPFTQKSFFAIDSSALRDRLKQLPWVDTVVIKRVWPSTLMITLTEHHPVARFNNEQLLNDQGELFTVPAALVPTNLPLFIGPNGQQNLIQTTYQQMNVVLTPLHVKITALSLDERQAWRLQLDNGIVILVGRMDPLIRLQRLVEVYPQMFSGKVATVDTIDLRYAHGISVRYKPLS